MSEYKIFHNPRCSKSRAALALLEENGIQAEVVQYLNDVPGTEELSEILKKLGLSARSILRTGEEAYKSLNLADKSLSEQTLIDAMVKNPILIERPIVVKGNHAVVGRPTERVLELIQSNV